MHFHRKQPAIAWRKEYVSGVVVMAKALHSLPMTRKDQR